MFFETTSHHGEDGHQISEGCLYRTCKKGVWRASMAGNLCCYERTPYTINTTISSSMSQDDIDCVEEIPGQAKMILSMKNYCHSGTDGTDKGNTGQAEGGRSKVQGGGKR